jgi:hypothetical protein
MPVSFIYYGVHMLLKNKLVILLLGVGLLFVTSCGGGEAGNLGIESFGFGVTVIDGTETPLVGIPYTVRKDGDVSVLLTNLTSDGTFRNKGDACVVFVKDAKYNNYYKDYLYIDDYDDVCLSLENNISPYYLIINDSSCPECNENYKKDFKVQCNEITGVNTCDITK